jgi:hypothetical protein
VFTARYGLSPYIKQIRFVLKGLIWLIYRICNLAIVVVLLIKSLYYELWTVMGMNESLICVARKNRKMMKITEKKTGIREQNDK